MIDLMYAWNRFLELLSVITDNWLNSKPVFKVAFCVYIGMFIFSIVILDISIVLLSLMLFVSLNYMEYLNNIIDKLKHKISSSNE